MRCTKCKGRPRLVFDAQTRILSCPGCGLQPQNGDAARRRAAVRPEKPAADARRSAAVGEWMAKNHPERFREIVKEIGEAIAADDKEAK